jgi:hypothetical protein
MPTDTREARTRAAVPCPLCGAGIGQPCRAGAATHDTRRGGEDRRAILHRAHQERREAWYAHKRAREADARAILDDAIAHHNTALFARGRKLRIQATACPECHAQPGEDCRPTHSKADQLREPGDYHAARRIAARD